jgi:hypothetical protein
LIIELRVNGSARIPAMTRFGPVEGRELETLAPLLEGDGALGGEAQATTSRIRTSGPVRSRLGMKALPLFPLPPGRGLNSLSLWEREWVRASSTRVTGPVAII